MAFTHAPSRPPSAARGDKPGCGEPTGALTRAAGHPCIGHRVTRGPTARASFRTQSDRFQLANSDPYPTMHAKHSLKHYDSKLDARLQAATNGWICVETYKTLRRIALLAGAGIVAATWFLPSVQPSQTALLVFAALILGPEVVEAYLTR